MQGRPASILRVRLMACVLAGVAACSGADDTDSVAFDTAQAARELTFKRLPPVAHVSPADFVADAKAKAAAQPESHYADVYDKFGRLGFFPKSEDLRADSSVAESKAGALYSSVTKRVSLVGSPEAYVLIHELVHALQDQHFDLTTFKRTELSTDERLARSALVEGDARIASWRSLVTSTGRDPLREIPLRLSPADIDDESLAKLTGNATVPPYFLAEMSFAYTFGAAYVGEQVGLLGQAPAWRYANIDALFVSRPPVSTQEIIRRGVGVDPIVPVGLTRMPADLQDQLEVEDVDRIGEWHSFLLMFPVAPSLVALRRLCSAWDGDQLVVLRERDPSVPPREDLRHGVLWTSAWDDATAAAEVARLLSAVHHATVDAVEPRLFRADDGEPLWIEQRNERVALVRNLGAAAMQQLAAAALVE